MREWVDELSDWIQCKEELSSQSNQVLDEDNDECSKFTEEFYQVAFETDVLLQVSDQLQLACSSILGKIDDVN